MAKQMKLNDTLGGKKTVRVPSLMDGFDFMQSDGVFDMNFFAEGKSGLRNGETLH